MYSSSGQTSFPSLSSSLTLTRGNQICIGIGRWARHSVADNIHRWCLRWEICFENSWGKAMGGNWIISYQTSALSVSISDLLEVSGSSCSVMFTIRVLILLALVFKYSIKSRKQWRIQPELQCQPALKTLLGPVPSAAPTRIL